MRAATLYTRLTTGLEQTMPIAATMTTLTRELALLEARSSRRDGAHPRLESRDGS